MWKTSKHARNNNFCLLLLLNDSHVKEMKNMPLYVVFSFLCKPLSIGHFILLVSLIVLELVSYCSVCRYFSYIPVLFLWKVFNGILLTKIFFWSNIDRDNKSKTCYCPKMLQLLTYMIINCPKNSVLPNVWQQYLI